MDIQKITTLGGHGKDGTLEPVNRVELAMGDIVSIVGPTGCGKTTLINDIELFANTNTPSGRQILINGEPVPDDFTFDPSKHPIALISQHTNFLSDLPVGEFLNIHAKVRGAHKIDMVVQETVEFANKLTREAIDLQTAMTELSGGQTRSLLIADEVAEWAESEGADYLFVETAGLCLRCSPYVENSLGIVVLEATSGMNLPRKIGPMLTLADISIITKIDLVSQAEREVFRYRVLESARSIMIVESNALYGIGIEPIVKQILRSPDIVFPMFLRGNPPVGTCTICAGKKEIGARNHFGVLRTMNEELFYVGE